MLEQSSNYLKQISGIDLWIKISELNKSATLKYDKRSLQNEEDMYISELSHMEYVSSNVSNE